MLGVTRKFSRRSRANVKFFRKFIFKILPGVLW